MDLKEKIEDLFTQKTQEDAEFSDCFLIEVELKPNNRLNVFLDSDSGITLAKCQTFSRFLEAHLDEKQWLGEKYWLEVSSPGLSRPLKVPRQFRKNIERKVEVRQVDQSPVVGILKEADEEKFAIEVSRVEREGKKKKEIVELCYFKYDEVQKVIVKPVFKKK